MSNETVGSVSGLWRFPVKSMGGERVDEVVLTPHGIHGDRAYALVEAETGKVVSSKSVRRFPTLLGCRAAFVEPPRAGEELPPVRISFPDESSVTSDSPDAADVLSRHLGRQVTLSSVAPENFTIDQYHPDIEDADPAGRRDVVADQPLGAAFFKGAGMPSPVPDSAFFDLFPVTVLTTSTLERLSELRPESRFDPRRFRMNVIVETSEPGFVENDWVGRELALGDQVRFNVTWPDPRCVMTTLAQEELPNDPDILRTLVRHNRLPLGDAGEFPCAGVYAVVTAPGTLHLGDPVEAR